MSRRGLCTLSVVVLFCGYHWNAWRVADGQWFAGFKRDSEGHILGRLLKSRQDGVFSAGGLTGLVARCRGSPPTTRFAADRWICRDLVRPASGGALHLRLKRGEWPSRELANFQYLAYGKGERFNVFSPYMSQVGGQGIAFGLLDPLLPMAPGARYKVYRATTALLAAIAVTFVVRWFHVEVGLGAALAALASGLLSQWLTAFARNLWWSAWAFFLPMVATMLWLGRARPGERGFMAKLGAVTCAGVLVKCLVNGFEFVSTAPVLAAVPFVFCAVRWRLGLRAAGAGLLSVAAGAGLAIVASLALLCFQIASLGGGWPSGLAHVRSAFVSRTHGNAESFPEKFAASLNAGTLEVVSDYLGGSFLGFGARQPSSTSALPERALEVPYGALVGLFAVASGLLWWRRKRLREDCARRDLALLAALWFSLLAPLSWFVVFKSHASEHPHLDYLVWQLPFTFFGFAVCGSVFERHVMARWRGRRPPSSGGGPER